MSIAEYYRDPLLWSLFTYLFISKTVRHRETTVTFNAEERVRNYAYLWEGSKCTSYIITNAVYKYCHFAVTVCREY
ncbi:MAG: hypothetical protein ACTSRU_16940 [Candidatus Hodarchaeales archaeon]